MGKLFEKFTGNFVLYSPVFCLNTGQCGAKNPVFTVVICSVSTLCLQKDMYYRTITPNRIQTPTALRLNIYRDLEGRKMRIAQIYVCVISYFLLKAVAFDVPS